MKKITESLQNITHGQADEVKIPALNRLIWLGFGLFQLGTVFILIYVAETIFHVTPDPVLWGMISIVIGVTLFGMGLYLDGLL